jgi:hypothetical protein
VYCNTPYWQHVFYWYTSTKYLLQIYPYRLNISLCNTPTGWALYTKISLNGLLFLSLYSRGIPVPPFFPPLLSFYSGLIAILASVLPYVFPSVFPSFRFPFLPSLLPSFCYPVMLLPSFRPSVRPYNTGSQGYYCQTKNLTHLQFRVHLQGNFRLIGLGASWTHDVARKKARVGICKKKHFSQRYKMRRQ